MAEVTIKGLSLWQPWASLMAVGAKQIETRGWSTNYRGFVAIHAAKHQCRDCKAAISEPRFSSALSRVYNTLSGEFSCELPYGAFIAIGKLHRVLSTNVYQEAIPARDSDEFHFGNYDLNRFMWVFDGVWKLKQPVYTDGKRGLYTLDEATKDVLISLLPDDAAEREFGE
jgi:activating signal cointegrator 1